MTKRIEKQTQKQRGESELQYIFFPKYLCAGSRVKSRSARGDVEMQYSNKMISRSARSFQFRFVVLFLFK